MIRTTLRRTNEIARMMISRATIRKTDDKHLLQQIEEADVYYSETPSNFERWQMVGFSAHPLKQDQQQQSQQGQQSAAASQSGGSSGNFNSNQPKGKAAEAIMLYPGGQRAHPIALVDDRRVRPYNMKEGCSAHYTPDNNGSKIYADKDKGVYHVVTDNPSYDPQTGQQSGKKVSRSAYTRHAEMDVQPRQISGGQQSGGSSGGGQQQSSQQQQEFKHQGKHVNHEHEHHNNGVNQNVDYDEDGGQKKTVYSYKVKEKEHKWDVNAEGKTTRVMDAQKIADSSDNHSTNANQTLTQQSGQSSSYSSGGKLFVGGATTHVHGKIIAEPINLGHFNKTALAAIHAAAAAGNTSDVHRLGALLGDDITDSGMTMTTSVASDTTPYEPDLGVPYNGFRWVHTTSGIEYIFYDGVWAEDSGGISFPASPAVNDTYSFQGKQWVWNGVGWAIAQTGTNKNVRNTDPEFKLSAALVPSQNAGMVFELTADNKLTIRVKGNDGTVRRVELSLV